MSERYRKLGFTGEQQEKILDERNAEAIERLKNSMKTIKDAFSDNEIPQQRMENERPELRPYNTEYINRPTKNVNELFRAGEIMDKARQAGRESQMRELEDLRNLAEFDDDPNSDLNRKIKGLEEILRRP